MSDSLTMVPAPGWAIVRAEDAQTTAGGIVLPNTNGLGQAVRLVLVRASAGHYKAGALVPCEIPVGARLFMAGDYVSGDIPAGCGAPPDHSLVQLTDIIAWGPVDGVAREVTPWLS